MNEYWFLLSFLILILLALPIILYPFGKSKAYRIVVPLVIVFSCLAYFNWGAWPEWKANLQKEASKQRIAAVLQTIKSPEELVERLKQRIAQEPDQARGWYLLGRLYASQGQWIEAREVFFKAHQLNPQDELVTVNYIQSLWQLNHQTLNKQINTLLTKVLLTNPKQVDALSMLAIDAYKQENYLEAINYWQKLLKLAPKQSEDAMMIRKAVAKAQALI
ncbi:MAG: tetratricopeptide repeat protein [Tatlockia sp.]|nr:tetratricopeptide repeat protein [Tatlockia sp.]